MPDKIEEILKRIHVLFAKGEKYQTSPDRIVISKHEMFELLEELSEALYEVMDQYEATARSREMARLEMDRQAAAIEEEAHRKADDVHAATLLYTDRMLDDLKGIIDKTRQNVKHDMLELLSQLESREDSIEQNKDGVKTNLSELHDNHIYLDMLEDIRKKESEKRRYGLTDEEFEAMNPKAPDKSNIVIRVDKPGENTGVTYSTKHSRKKSGKGKQSKAKPDDERIELADNGDEGLPTPQGTVFTADDFNLDAEYEQWKDEQSGEAPETPAKTKKKFFGLL